MVRVIIAALALLAPAPALAQQSKPASPKQGPSGPAQPPRGKQGSPPARSAPPGQAPAGAPNARQPAQPGPQTRQGMPAAISRPVTIEGWTKLDPSPDTKLVYVSASEGRDTNTGSAPNQALRSLAAGYARLRDGQPDWLLLKRGDTWETGLPPITKSGRSAAAPMVIGVYGPGEERAKLRAGLASPIMRAGGDGSRGFVAFVGLDMEPTGYTGAQQSVGLRWVGSGRGILVEDCRIAGYQGNIIFQGIEGTIQDLRIRRCVITDSHSASSHSQGIYISNADGVVIQENVIDHNGWKEGVAPATKFNHNIYLQANVSANTAVVGNILANASSHGAQMRGGGFAEDNLVIGCPIGILFGSSAHDYVSTWATGAVRENVVIDSRDIDATQRLGWGITVENAKGAPIERNLVAHQRAANAPVAFSFNHKYGDLTLTNNVVYDWMVEGRGGVGLRWGPDPQSRVTVRGMVIQQPRGGRVIERFSAPPEGLFQYESGRYYSADAREAWFRTASEGGGASGWGALERGAAMEQVRFPDPTRDVASYNQTVGGKASVEDFLERARRQSRATWKDELTAKAANEWIRAGFGL